MVDESVQFNSKREGFDPFGPDAQGLDYARHMPANRIDSGSGAQNPFQYETPHQTPIAIDQISAVNCHNVRPEPGQPGNQPSARCVMSGHNVRSNTLQQLLGELAGGNITGKLKGRTPAGVSPGLVT
jgi:hypothetical protein